ncbi:hypothetical protein IE81DRAFT_319522 [Ceraceosorus guamensis]|uniref:Secreted protein n=1 Tax=Ceraceosorus guamensis TaxID=1522189 RepID=A0A316W8A3_9BASI|nr:hypothetical protein IE81DRAFT_319522 [Ceraceosorus guamensis]PWN46140.1 hypothetical protein IE81DRAFT_319522 [Ceraceosorus guamensis]
MSSSRAACCDQIHVLLTIFGLHVMLIAAQANATRLASPASRPHRPCSLLRYAHPLSHHQTSKDSKHCP